MKRKTFKLYWLKCPNQKLNKVDRSQLITKLVRALLTSIFINSGLRGFHVNYMQTSIFYTFLQNTVGYYSSAFKFEYKSISNMPTNTIYLKNCFNCNNV